MRISFLTKRLLVVVTFLSLSFVQVAAQTSPNEAAKSLPGVVGDFRAQGAAREATPELEQLAPEDFDIVASAAREYSGRDGKRLRLTLVKTRSAGAAYSLLKYSAARPTPARTQFVEGVGITIPGTSQRLSFMKGQTFAEISGGQGGGAEDATLLSFARQFAATLEGEEGDIPPLVLHLPNWESVNEKTAYAVTLAALQKAVGGQPILDAVSFEGGAEAATSAYDTGRLVVVEYTTPQYASDNDRRINERLAQLRASGEPTPTLYRRIGNYAVFVFGATDETAAAALADSVKWEKDVRWLGESPNTLKRAQRAYYNMTGSTILNVLIVTGFSILLCLGVGGLFGGAVFLYRRAQGTSTRSYTDAGGMVRLNIDEMSAEGDGSKLLRPSDG